MATQKGDSKKIAFLPGVNTNLAASDTLSAPRWKDVNRVRWSQGLPEKILGWRYFPLVDVNGVAAFYEGISRALHDWSSLDAQFWIAIGTECKLYVVNNSILYDITPSRQSSNVNNPFTTINASAIVTVSDVNHKANVGDNVQIFSTSAVGGLTITGYFTIASVIDPDTYTITASSNATSSATGGGGVTFTYDISCGLPSNGELLGYGTGLFGAGTFGTPREAGSGVPARLRTWSLENFGEDLIASDSDGEIYWWQKSTGPNSRAILLTDAPVDVQRMIIDSDRQFVLAIGCSNLDRTPNLMRIAWCTEGDFTVWRPVAGNSAGGLTLSQGSRLITAIKSNQQILVWSDTFMYQLPFVGAPNFYGQLPIGKCSIVGPNAVVDDNGTVYFWAFDNFMKYDGTLSILECDVWESVINSLDKSQAEKVYCSTYQNKSEITWFFPSIPDADRITVEGDTRTTDTGETRVVDITSECDSYVTYNRHMNCWYFGRMDRTAYHDISSALTGTTKFPYSTNAGILYKQEFGLDEVESAVLTNSVNWFLESYDFSLTGSSDQHMLINYFVPNCVRQTGDINLTYFTKNFPNDAAYTQEGPVAFQATTPQVGLRARGSQVSLRLDGDDLGGDFRFGTFQITMTPYGKRG